MKNRDKNKNINTTEEAIEAEIKKAEDAIEEKEEDVEDVDVDDDTEITDIVNVPRPLDEGEKKALEKYHNKLEKKQKVKATLKKAAKPAAIIGGGLAVVGGVLLAIAKAKNGDGETTDSVEFIDYPTLPEDGGAGIPETDMAGVDVESAKTETPEDYIV